MTYLAVLLGLSLALNAFTLYQLAYAPRKKKELSVDARKLLQDLMTGPALLKVEYVDRQDVLLRSPRDYS